MKLARFAAIAALSLSVAATAASPTVEDIGAVRAYVQQNKAYAPAAKAEALRRTDQLTAYLGDQPRFDLEVARIVALADNGHNVMFPGQWTSRYPRSPVRFGRFADGLYVIAAPAEHQVLVGRKVDTINRRPWRQVYDGYKPFQGGEQAFRDQFATFFIETPALLAAAGLGSANALSVRVEGAAQVEVTPALAPLKGHGAMLAGALPRAATPLIKGEHPLYLRDPHEMFVRHGLPELDATYVRLDGIEGEQLKPFLEATLEHLERERPRHLILDLRFNMGGDLNRARDFAQRLPGIVPAQIYAITSGRTFSAAISTLGYLKQAAGDRLTIVGEPIGDRLEFWAEGGPVKLPGLGATLRTATERHNYVTGCPEADCHRSVQIHSIKVKSLQPDLPTSLSFADYIAGRDPAMGAIATDIGRRSRQ